MIVLFPFPTGFLYLTELIYDVAILRNKYENIFYWTISEKYSLSARQLPGAITDVKKIKVSLTNFEKKI